MTGLKSFKDSTSKRV